ncbi:MAG TPA: sigma factor-like helix-turn-helix DNA-binding protein [Methylomirabilota bacterium]|nr:sigma factor-like helix-turn-helix DNA-binding protein [Methylomirabilota bacterium]
MLPKSRLEQLETALEPYVALWRRAYPGKDFLSRSLLRRPQAAGRGERRLHIPRRGRSGEGGEKQREERPPDVPEAAVDPAESIVARALTDEEAELLRGTPIEELGISARAKRLPGKLGWRTALDVAAAPALAALRTKNCGRRTVAELRAAVSRALETRASGEPTVSTEPEEVRRFVDEMVRSLGEKAEFVVRERFGLWDATRETLEDIGYALGRTRERVRQIEAKSLRQLRESPWRRPSVKLLRRLRDEVLTAALSSDRCGVLTEEELSAIVDPERDISQEEGQKLRSIAVRFLSEVFAVDLALDDGRFVRVGDRALFISQEAADRYLRIEAAARTFLIGQGRPVPLQEATKALRRYGVETTDAELERFAEVSGTIGLDWTNSLGLRRWRFFERRNLAAVAQRALMELGQSTHFSYITDRVNAIAPDGRIRDGHAVTATMLRYPDVFVSLGRGMYGLRDWGISRPPFIKDFLVGAIQERGGRAHTDDLAAFASQKYGFKKTSISMTLNMNPQLFKDLEGAGMPSRDGACALARADFAHAPTG